MIYVYGAGNGGQMWAELAAEAGLQIAGFIDDSKEDVGRPDALNPNLDSVIPAIYSNKVRLSIADRFLCQRVIHPKAHVYKSATVGAGSLLKPFSYVGARTFVGTNCILDSGAIVEHDSFIDSGCYISVGAKIGSSVKLGKRVLVGMGVVIQSGVSIGDDVVINSGSVVFADVPAGKTVKPRI